MCVCVCVCVWVFLANGATSSSRVASHSKDPWWFPNILCLIVIVAGHSQSQWRRSCTSRRQFGLIGSWDRLSRLRYCLREGWWPDRRRATKISSFLLLICFVSWEIFMRNVGRLGQRVRVLVERCELFHWQPKWNPKMKQKELCLWQWRWLLWLPCWLDRYLEWQNDQGPTAWRWKMIWSWWKCELRRFEDLMKWDLQIRICCLCKRVWRSKDNWRWWVSRIMLNPWQLLPPHRSW